VDLSAIIQQAVEAARARFASEQRELSVSLPAEALQLAADPVRLAQIFGNLLNNAFKFTHTGGQVALTAQRQGGDVLVTVRDNGIGIAPEKLNEVFEMFAQVDGSPGRSRGGLGIGLSLVKRLVELHGGTVNARSPGVGKGSEFSVRLPLLAQPAAPVPEPRANPAPSIPPRSILVADDNKDAAFSLVSLLKYAGHQTHVAYDGREAFELAQRVRPQVILLDIGMPNMSGHDACRAIRQQPWSRGVRIIALTGWGTQQDLEKSRQAGFDAHLVKPVDFAALSQVLHEQDQSRTNVAV
jgi:CheY-like chemotaxis protein